MRVANSLAAVALAAGLGIIAPASLAAVGAVSGAETGARPDEPACKDCAAPRPHFRAVMLGANGTLIVLNLGLGLATLRRWLRNRAEA